MQDNLNQMSVAAAPVEARSQFIWKCYAHVAGAIVAFAAIESYLITSGIAAAMFEVMMGNWLIVLGAFILVSWGATHVAHRLESTAAQYAAFAIFVFAEALIFAPIILLALAMNPAMVESAAIVTLVGCAGLVATAMITRKDFSFMRGLLVWGGMLALGAIVFSLIFGAHLGTWFSVAMIGFAGIAVLYDTSNIMHHYPTDKYVAASMALFASIALMFWYVLRLFMSRD